MANKEQARFDIEAPRLVQIIQESTDIITATTNPKTSISRHDDIIRSATRLFEIMPQGKTLTMEFNKRPISSAADLYVVEEEKLKWLDQHGFSLNPMKEIGGKNVMNEQQIVKLASMLDPSLWRNPRRSIDTLLRHYISMMDYRDLSHSILRSGTALTKEEKKRAGINPNAKIGQDIFTHFTEVGLHDCVPLATELALAISAIACSSVTISDSAKRGTKRIVFEAGPDCCALCEKLRGEYPIEQAPAIILDTHLGCRCGYTYSQNCL